MNKIEIYKSKKTARIIIFTGLLLAISGGWFIQYADKSTIGGSFIILSILCLIFGIGSWFDRKPYIILTESGITEMFSIREEIEWSAIRQADEFYYRGQYFIRLLLDRNYKPTLMRPAWFYRLDRLYENEGLKAMYIRIAFLEVNSIALAQFINKMIKADAATRIKLLNSWRNRPSQKKN